MKTTRNRANTSGRALRSSTSRAGLVLRSAKRKAGFTLLEVLVAMTIMAILGAALFTMFNQSSRTWQRAEARTSQFSAAREMLGMMAMELRQAVVNPHAGGNFGAHFYGLAPGDNAFNRTNDDTSSGQIYFVAPTETRTEHAEQDVCVIGYWVEDDPSSNPPGKRLMRYCLSDKDKDGNPNPGWDTFAPNANVESQDLGLNVSSLTFKFWGPGDSDWKGANRDTWSSETGPPGQKDALPRAVQITLVVTDPRKALGAEDAEHDRTFITVVQLDAAR